MIDPYLSQHVLQAAEKAAERASRADVACWIERLHRVAANPQLLYDRLERAKELRWAGATPCELADARIDPAGQPLGAIGVDGSQVYPDERSPVQWAYVQVVAYQVGAEPIFHTRFVDLGSELAAHNPEVVECRDEALALVNAWRTLMEVETAAGVVRPDAVTLLDGGLLPWLSVSRQERHLDAYLRTMKSNQVRRQKIAGVISNPQSRLLVHMIHLAEAACVEEGVKQHDGTSDSALMRYLLQPGQRSALFIHASPRNEVFALEGAQVWFFFLRINRNEIVRVEIPIWAARRPEALQAIHATLLADSQATGYSYALSQAHRLAVVPADVAALLQQAGVMRYWAQVGSLPMPGAKVTMKRA